MKNKFLKRTMALGLATVSLAGVVGMAACKKGAPDTEQSLEVLCWDAGYGTKWCSDLLDEFKKEAWVKEKYPNLQIAFTSDGDGSTINTKIDAGKRANTVDLFFTGGIDKYLGKDATGFEFFADLTESVYNQEVPGEKGKVKDKMLPTYVESMRFYEKGWDPRDPNVAFKSYVFPWASGMNSILYNEDHLYKLGMEVPLTTNQFIAACDEISTHRYFDYNNKDKGDYAILRDSGGAYWEYLYPAWWGQYEGIAEYRNFFNGVDYEGFYPSADVYNQKGKLHALSALEQILRYDNGYTYKLNSTLGFMEAQTLFLQGDGVFYANGDWFSKEMEETAAKLEAKYPGKYKDTIRMMKTPIISEIIERTPSIPDEETLRAVIRCVDKKYGSIEEVRLDSSYYTGDVETILEDVTADDYKIIKDARSIVHAIGPNHQAGVPSYAKGKQVAFDFLRYMATDKAQEIYLKATGGASLPFDYNLQVENNALYKELFEGDDKRIFQIEKDRLDYVYNQCYETEVLPDPDSFPLVKWGNMAAVYSTGGHSLVAHFSATNVKEDAQLAKDLWESDIAYYIKNGAFDTCVTLAGLK